MGFLLLLKFALLCIDFLAWPVIALGYPLFASIRAIETGSKYHMMKLVIYWTLFSIISLFEYALVKIIEWIPFWSSIKLVAIFWLVIPRFHGAYYAYQRFVRPHLVVNLQEAIDRFYKPKEEEPCAKEMFLDVAEKYIKENGSEALEKLIASKVSYMMELKGPDNSAQKDKEILEAPEKIAVTEANQLQVHHPRPITTASWVPKKTTYAAAKIKDITPPEASTENRKPSAPPPLKKVEPEWNCPLCHVTTTCEKNLNDHLQGEKHKSMCVSLKTSKLNAQDTGSSLSGKSNQNKVGDGSKQETCQKPEETVQNQGSSSNKQKPDVAEKYIKENGCEALEKLIESKLKEPDAAQKDEVVLEAPEKIAGTEAKQLQVHHPRPITSASWVPKETTYAAAKNKDVITSPETSSENREPSTTPPLKIELAEWSCPLCHVTTTCEKNLNDHLHGEKHKSMCESLKTSKLNAQDTGSSLSGKSNQNKVGDGSKQETCQKPEETVKNQGSSSNKQKPDVAEEYIKENGCEALEKLFESKLKEHDAAQKDKVILESPAKIAGTEAKQLQVHHPRPITTASWVPKETTYAAAKNKDTSPETSSENREPSTPPPLKKVEPAEWSCPLCHVTTTCEKNLNDHLQGKKHKSMYESLKTSKLNAQDTRPTSSTGKDGISQHEFCKKPEGSRSNKQKPEGSTQDGAASEEVKLWCNVCNLKLLCEIDVESHLKGKRHWSNIRKMVEFGGVVS